MPYRRRSAATETLDVTVATLVALIAANVWFVAAAGTAGPFGGALYPAILLTLLAAPLLLSTLVMRLLGRSGTRRSTLGVLLALAALGAGIGAIPVRERIAERLDERRAVAVERALDARARRCAAQAAAQVPDEPETNPGVHIRPRMTARTEACVERTDTKWLVVCNAGTCQATPPPSERGPTLVVLLKGYMDEALVRRGAGRWDRWPQPGVTVPPPPWIVRG